MVIHESEGEHGLEKSGRGMKKKKKEDSDRNTKTTVTIPYIKGFQKP